MAQTAPTPVMLSAAATFVVTTSADTHTLARHLDCPNGCADLILANLEACGIVGSQPANGGARTVRATDEELSARFAGYAHRKLTDTVVRRVLDLAMDDPSYPLFTPTTRHEFQPTRVGDVWRLADAVTGILAWPSVGTHDGDAFVDAPTFAFESDPHVGDGALPLHFTFNASIDMPWRSVKDVFDVSQAAPSDQLTATTGDEPAPVRGEGAALAVARNLITRARHTHALACDVAASLSETRPTPGDVTPARVSTENGGVAPTADQAR